MPVFNYALRRRGSCIGWQCLTSAEQFGVIFSSIIVFLILSLVYMYCLGKAITYRRSKESREPPRYIDSGAIVRHAAINVATAPSTALYPTIALMTPAYYNQVAIPFPQSHMAPTAFRGIPVAAPTYRRDAGQSIPISQPLANTLEQPGCKQGGQRANIVNPNMSAESQTATPGWRQLLHRALRLPLGQAHTIYSESNPSSPRDSRSETVVSPGCAQQSDIQAENVDERVERQPRVHSAENSSAEDGCDEAETASIATDAATVHSDDFQMLSPPSSIDSPSGT
ncbi:hypothetical protein E4U13_005582 [Claviceps humidiphila]|uniref:Uncharacterized protein n=1 Tax=Claviceps humidiphila TaxID=1294629 RepID=A0A9P7Q4V6_9HYPO|nr:hypothetical protein E4U13_005582 [Claviceps humidiphila]